MPIKRLIFRVAKRLYVMHLLPWCIWSPIYDAWHRDLKKIEWRDAK